MPEYFFSSLEHLPLITATKGWLSMAWEATACHLGLHCQLNHMALARFNVYWYLWALTPLVIMTTTCWTSDWKKRWRGALASIAAVYVLSNLAVARKWDLRLAQAGTLQEFELATADGANMVFTAYLMAPLEAIFFTLFWGVFSCLAWKIYRTTRHPTP